MKIALLGAGKTGGRVKDLHPDTVIFNSKNLPSVDKLKVCDVVISFLAGDIFLSYIPLLIEAKLPVVTGSTGFDWPKNIENQIKEQNLKWVRSHNFSLGMNIVKSMIETLSKSTELYDDASFNIHDIHHTKKVDSPSGTALSWESWLNKEATITAERKGDIVGYHHLEMNSPMEKIKITHEAKDRAIFASGAIWAAKHLLKDPTLEAGLIDFNQLVKKHLNI
jgi:4-hydroxy-tetrahydrodipicolinate reductase